MTVWGWIWAGWLTAVAVSFGVLEGVALSVTPADTLSDTERGWFHVVAGQAPDHWTLPHVLAVMVLVTLALVLVFHLGLGWWFTSRGPRS